MTSAKKPLDKLEETLRAGHRRQQDIQLPPAWRHQVMRDIRSKAGPKVFPGKAPAETLIPRRLGALAAGALAVLLGWIAFAHLDWHDPWITLKPDLAAPQPHGAFWLEAGDRDSGLRHLKVTVIQKTMEFEVLSHDLERLGEIGGAPGQVARKVEMPLAVNAQALGLTHGRATIVVTARDLSWRNWFKGRVTIFTKEIEILAPALPEGP